jgi:osmoprotectant transport system substrate-binding protein
MQFGGEPEFYGREQGTVGLGTVYGVSFGQFEALDYAGSQPGTPVDAPVQALEDKQVQAADVFTTDPWIKVDHLVSLADPENLFGVDNVVPLVYRPALTANPHLRATLNAVSVRLTQSALLTLDTEVIQQHVSVTTAARNWLAASHL